MWRVLNVSIYAVLILALALVVLAVASELIARVDAYRLFGGMSGEIRSGEVAGIRVGDEWASADSAVRKHFKPEYTLWLRGCRSDVMGRVGVEREERDPIFVGRAEIVYRDRSIRNGSVSLCLTDGVVSSVAWSYSGPLYVDL